MPIQDAMNPAVVARYTTIGEAESARSALDAAGFEVDVADANVISINWLYSNAVGGVKLVVRDDDLERAFDLLSTPSREANADDEVTEAAAPQADDPPTVCPSCGSAKLARIQRLKIFGALAVVAFGIGVAINEPGLALALIASLGLIIAFVPSHRCTSEPEREASLPTASEMLEPQCRRCGSSDVFRIHRRRLKVIPLYFVFTVFVIVPICLLLPRRRCDQCGLRTYF